MRHNCLITFLLAILLMPAISLSQNNTDYLIMQDIGAYKLDVPEAVFEGEPPSGGAREYDGSGIVAGAKHFSNDHLDKTYTVMYIGGDVISSPTVQITQHSGSDSDKWLLHEVERGFRDSDNLEASPAEDTMIRAINNNNIFFYGGGIVGYRWVSNNLVVNIQYTNLSGPKPEPLEVVQAYLSKHPSTITLTDSDLKSSAHNNKWIKDEMERRLWLCDKWFYELQKETVEIDKVVRESFNHMKVFLDYREKYYGISAKEEKLTLWRYKQANNGTGIKNKLAEHKIWWKVNKDKPINL